MGVKEFVFVSGSALVCFLLLVVLSDGPPSTWRFSSVGDQSGKVVICTGANSGTGFQFSRHMAANGATVIMACRSPERCSAAAQAIRKEFPKADVHTFELDLSSLRSVSRFADKFKNQFDRLDILMNNAGLMGQNKTSKEDTHIQVNHLGHFALTGHLLSLLSATSSLPNPHTNQVASRIITVSSIGEKIAMLFPETLDIEDLHFENRPYDPYVAYPASKIANVYFFKELHKRIQEKGLNVLSLGVHPGFSRTELQDKAHALRDPIVFVADLSAQTAEMGAAPLLYAATSEKVESGEYYGPGSACGLWGWPKRVDVVTRNLDTKRHQKLWEKSMELTDVYYP